MMVRSEGLTLLEVLLVVAVIGILGALGISFSAEALARQRVEAATRRVLLGLERGRLAAERRGVPCALALDAGGWRLASGAGLLGCEGSELSFGEGVSGAEGLRLEHNLPEAVRFSSNGLVLDGGTVLVGHPGTELVRCVVVSLPLGVTRVGLYGNGVCRPDPAL
jgi:prepilin-type N-terminal cleavage/methylation domain-containing protein